MDYNGFLKNLENKGGLRVLSDAMHQGFYIKKDDIVMLNLSSNDYLGIASDVGLRSDFLSNVKLDDFLFTSSSSRLLTGNFPVYGELETILAKSFKAEAALVFNSGYHANTGILPAVCTSNDLILADKFVHASIVDGIRLSRSEFIRYRHNDYMQLEDLIKKHYDRFDKIFVVTESIFSMDGDEADLKRLVELKNLFPKIMLYVDEAHAIGVRGKNGLGCAEDDDCLNNIDFLVGTFGKALASVGAYVICSNVMREYLCNTVRTLIYTTALPPINLMWTKFVFERLSLMQSRRDKLAGVVFAFEKMLSDCCGKLLSKSHIMPFIVGSNSECLSLSKMLNFNGFYALPVRPPTVPSGTARIRFSLHPEISDMEIESLRILLMGYVKS